MIVLSGFISFNCSTALSDKAILVPGRIVTPASKIQPSPIAVPVQEFAPKSVFSPILTGTPSVPDKTPRIEAPPPTSDPAPTTAEEEILPQP